MMFQFTHPGRGATGSLITTREGTGAFQFTHPGRGATEYNLHLSATLKFQFTHPGRGATHTSRQSWRALDRFNSRTPGGVRLIEVKCTPFSLRVSIHAPREGCDIELLSDICSLSEFQFTHPGRGATEYRFNPFRLLAYQFQFTHPGRGATDDGVTYTSSAKEFQFTHPGRGATSIGIVLSLD